MPLDQLLDEISTSAGRLVQWHLDEARRVEREAANTDMPQRRERLLSAARYHRDCAADCAAWEEDL